MLKEIIDKFELKKTDFINGYFKDGTENKGYSIDDNTVLFLSTKNRIVFDYNIIEIHRIEGNYRAMAKVSIDFLKQISKKELMLFIDNRLVKQNV